MPPNKGESKRLPSIFAETKEEEKNCGSKGKTSGVEDKVSWRIGNTKFEKGLAFIINEQELS